MFDWLKRLFRVFAAEANSVMDKIEDPSKMAEQGVKELKNDLTKSMAALADVKASSIRAKRSHAANLEKAAQYEQKAMLLLQTAEKGQISASEADRLAGEALNKRAQILAQIQTEAKSMAQYDDMVKKMEANVQKLKQQVGQWESEMKSLQARSKVSAATAKINKQLSSMDSGGTIAMLDRMKEKVAQQEALAESYAEMADMNTSVDDEIDRALGKGAKGIANPAYVSPELAALKAKLAAQLAAPPATNHETPKLDATSEPLTPINLELEKLKEKLRKKD